MESAEVHGSGTNANTLGKPHFWVQVFFLSWINRGEKNKYLQSLQDSHTIAWQICYHVSFHLLRLKEGRREVTWWFLAYLLDEHWEHRCHPFQISDLLHLQHTELGGHPGCWGSDAQSSFPTPNPQRQEGRTRSPDKQNYLTGETSDCKKNGLIRRGDVFSGVNKKSSGRKKKNSRKSIPVTLDIFDLCPKDALNKLCFLRWLKHWISRLKSVAKPFHYMLQLA